MPDRQIKKALVLGGTGFMGSHFIDLLLRQDVAVSVLLHHRAAIQQGLRILHGDLGRFDWTQLEADLPDVIVHFARIPGLLLWPSLSCD